MTLKEILENIGRRHGVEQLNPMQQAVQQSRADRIILLAPTGSGKTLAFAVPLISRLEQNDGKVQAVVIAPSRELVIQIAEVIRPISEGHRTVALYGGHPMPEEINSLQVTPDIIVATPGRLLDHLQRHTVDISSARQLVLDEYDKSLELGFHDQMRRIVKQIRRLRYVMLTSATPIETMPDFLDMSQARVIDFSAKTESPRSRMRIALVVSQDRDKLQELIKLLRALPDGRVIVFVNHRESAERVYEMLKREDMPCGLYHGGMDQLRREIAIDMLNNGSTPILVSTDLGSRGLDIEAVKAVVHYHLPVNVEAWTHRNGRTARVDATGNIYLLVSEGENIPDYIDYDYRFVPDGNNPDPIHATMATIYINAGRKEKISKSDILGFIVKQAGLEAKAVGRIVLKDHCALVAVPIPDVNSVIETAKTTKLKGQRVKASRL